MISTTNRRKIFISHYKGDRNEVDAFIQDFSTVFIPKVLGANDNDDFINSTNSDYVMQRIGDNKNSMLYFLKNCKMIKLLIIMMLTYLIAKSSVPINLYKEGWVGKVISWDELSKSDISDVIFDHGKQRLVVIANDRIQVLQLNKEFQFVKKQFETPIEYFVCNAIFVKGGILFSAFSQAAIEKYIDNDLKFLSEGSIYYWDEQTNSVSKIIDGLVQDMIADETGQRVLLLDRGFVQSLKDNKKLKSEGVMLPIEIYDIVSKNIVKYAIVDQGRTPAEPYYFAFWTKTDWIGLFVTRIKSEKTMNGMVRIPIPVLASLRKDNTLFPLTDVNKNQIESTITRPVVINGEQYIICLTKNEERQVKISYCHIQDGVVFNNNIIDSPSFPLGNIITFTPDGSGIILEKVNPNAPSKISIFNMTTKKTYNIGESPHIYKSLRWVENRYFCFIAERETPKGNIYFPGMIDIQKENK